jgi:succinate dehydrogenase / fumarate reductase cytochrome b subunit
MQSSIIKKFFMALSGIFLMIFLLQHLAINLTSLIPDNGETFNTISHFMGYNPIVQFVLQPILIFGVCFHFVMGFILEYQNRKARVQKYILHKTRSSWISRNMIISGLVILAFLILHFDDFWLPEINDKYINPVLPDPEKYFLHLQEQFYNQTYRTIFYCISFVLLGLHLNHGLASSFQSVGVSSANKHILKIAANLYSITITVGFISIAIFHYFIH